MKRISRILAMLLIAGFAFSQLPMAARGAENSINHGAEASDTCDTGAGVGESEPDIGAGVVPFGMTTLGEAGDGDEEGDGGEGTDDGEGTDESEGADEGEGTDGGEGTDEGEGTDGGEVPMKAKVPMRAVRALKLPLGTPSRLRLQIPLSGS